eukprot:jgi/Orpsp1_1/1188600/evm.model.d7180000066007.1
MSILKNKLAFINFLLLIQHCISKIVNVSNSNDILNFFSDNNSDDTVTIVVNNNIEVTNQDEIILKDDINNLIFQGISVDTSSLDLSNIKNGISFYSSVKKIEFSNLRVDGHFFFDSNKNVTYHNCDFYGSIDYVLKNNDEGEFNFKNSNYYGIGNKLGNCIMLENINANFYGSKLYGNILCESNRLVNFIGNGKSSITINESLVSGENENSLFYVEKGNIISNNSKFLNFFSIDNPGGAFYIVNNESSKFIQCKFDNGYSKDRGAVFNLYNSKKFVGKNIEANDITAEHEGTLFYISSETIFVTTLVLEHITQTNIVTKTTDGKGLIIFFNSEAVVKLYDFYGKNFKSYNNEGTLFMLNIASDIYVENFIFEDAWCKAKGFSAFLYHTIDNNGDNGIFKINGCYINNISMNTDFDMKFIGWNTKGRIIIE